MYITLERLIDGCIHTLRDEVMPEVGTRVARGQVWAVIDILQNMRNRIEEKAELFEAESASAEQALAQLVAALCDAGAGSDAAALERACADAPTGPPGERRSHCAPHWCRPSTRSTPCLPKTRFPRPPARRSAPTSGRRPSATSCRSPVPS